MKRHLIIAWVAALPLLAATILPAQEMSPKFKELLAQPRRVRELPKGEAVQAQFIAEGRAFLTNSPGWDQRMTHRLSSEQELVMAALIDLGDRHTLEETLAIYLATRSVIGRRPMRELLGGSSRLEIIPAIAEDLFREERADMVLEYSEFFNHPHSVQAMLIICSVLANSDQVKPEVRAWAASLRKAHSESQSESQRAQVREWWLVNKGHFVTRSYGSVMPPAEAKTK